MVFCLHLFRPDDMGNDTLLVDDKGGAERPHV